MPKPELTEDLREKALSALRRILNPTAHTDSCFELRAMGVKNCTKACARIRETIEALSGEPVPNPNWPEGDDAPPHELILRLGHSDCPLGCTLERGRAENGESA